MKENFKYIKPFLPLLALYIILVIVFASDELFGDEFRHLRYANNLVDGFYSEKSNPSLINGPGYPIILTPFVFFGINLLMAKILNAVFLFVAIIYFKKTLDLFSIGRYSLYIAYIVGLYPPILRWLPTIYSEPLAFFLICAIAYHFCKLIQKKEPIWKDLLLVSFYLGYLTLVKIIFFQVIVISLLCLAILLFWKKNRIFVKKTLIVIGGAFIIISPYVLYSFQLTNKLFLLGTGGGEILYHHSTPYENEWGNWFAEDAILMGQNETYVPDGVYNNLHELSKNHYDVYKLIEPLSHIERDSVLKTIAIDHMKKHPNKYLKNTVSNVGRFLFHYPFSYRNQDMSAYGYMIPNMFIIVLWLLSLYPFLIKRQSVPFEIKAFMLFSLIYASGIILLDGRGRNFIIMVPSLALFVSYIYFKVLNITFQNSVKDNI